MRSNTNGAWRTVSAPLSGSDLTVNRAEEGEARTAGREGEGSWSVRAGAEEGGTVKEPLIL